MKKPITIPINIVVEDSLSEAVIRKILNSQPHQFYIGYCYQRRGFGYIKLKKRGFNNAAQETPYLVLADLEDECAPKQIEAWLPEPMHPNLLFRIAVQEVESWLLADKEGLSSFLGISANLIQMDIENIADPKKHLINLARRSRKRSLRESLVPRSGSTAKIGPDYNGQLSSFVANQWDIESAMKNSDSLRRTISAINRFQPTWQK